MYTWINKQGVKNSKGFIVQRTGRFTAEYEEGSKKLTIDLENGELSSGKFCEIVRVDSIKKWDDGSYISNEKKAEIMKNFKEAMEFQDIAVIYD